MTTNYLHDVAKRRLDAVEKRLRAVPLKALEAVAAKQPPCRDFAEALRGAQGVAVIAEMKRRSPSAGPIREPYEPGMLAAAYEQGGAAALSVLTEPDDFGGALEDIGVAKNNTALPVLQKDFLIDPYQVVEARAFGADAVLLIADLLPPGLLERMVATAKQVGVQTLVEVFSPDILKEALEAGGDMFGINTRNLNTLDMIPDNVYRILPRVPKDRLVVAESGIKEPGEVTRLAQAGVHAVLVGESLLRSADPASAVRQLVEAGRNRPG